MGLLLPPQLWGRPFLLLLSVAVAQSRWPSDPSEAILDWEHQLEASMHSVLPDVHEAVPTVVGIPDSTAVVGRPFRVTVPTDVIAPHGEPVKVSLDVGPDSGELPFSPPFPRLGCQYHFDFLVLSSSNSETC